MYIYRHLHLPTRSAALAHETFFAPRHLGALATYNMYREAETPRHLTRLRRKRPTWAQHHPISITSLEHGTSPKSLTRGTSSITRPASAPAFLPMDACAASDSRRSRSPC